MNKSLALKMFGVLSSQPPIEIWHLYLSCVMNMIHLSHLIKWVSLRIKNKKTKWVMCILNLLNLTNITKNLDGLLLILIVFFFLN